jgi:hypothetical protein
MMLRAVAIVIHRNWETIDLDALSARAEGFGGPETRQLKDRLWAYGVTELNSWMRDSSITRIALRSERLDPSHGQRFDPRTIEFSDSEDDSDEVEPVRRSMTAGLRRRRLGGAAACGQ